MNLLVDPCVFLTMACNYARQEGCRIDIKHVSLLKGVLVLCLYRNKLADSCNTAIVMTDEGIHHMNSEHSKFHKWFRFVPFFRS